MEDGLGVTRGKGQAGNQQPTKSPPAQAVAGRTASSLAQHWGERNSTQFPDWEGEEKAKVVNYGKHCTFPALGARRMGTHEAEVIF